MIHLDLSYKQFIYKSYNNLSFKETGPEVYNISAGSSYCFVFSFDVGISLIVNNLLADEVTEMYKSWMWIHERLTSFCQATNFRLGHFLIFWNTGNHVISD